MTYKTMLVSHEQIIAFRCAVLHGCKPVTSDYLGGIQVSAYEHPVHRIVICIENAVSSYSLIMVAEGEIVIPTFEESGPSES